MEYEIYGYALVPLVTALVEVFKKLGIPNRFAPLLSVTFGLIIAPLFNLNDIKFGLVVGIVVGLASCGLYDGIQSAKKIIG